jgi:rsbT co-antagonist protein RsbR
MATITSDKRQSLLENAPNIILIVDKQGKIEYINRTIPGMSVDEVVGKQQLDFVSPEHQETVKTTNAQVFRTGESASYEIQGPGPDGSLAWYSTLVGPIRETGDIVAVSVFTADVSDRKKAEEDLRKAKDDLIAQQSMAIRELSTPVIQIWDDILVLPLIGTVDTQRAQQVIENLLDSIVKTQASVAIMDITGVPVVDTMVANHLLSTINAAKMLGAEVIVTGVSPNNAQTLVKLGVDLTTITTKGSLQAGLKLAFEITDNQVSKKLS